MQLQGRVAIVTGGGGYIGQSIARVFAGEGASVAVCDLNAESAQRTADEISIKGGRAVAVKLDVCQTASIDSMVNGVIKQFGRIDILLNVAGGSARERWSPVHGSSEEVIREIININLFGTIFCCRAVVGHMIERNSGRIVNIGSALGVQGQARFAEYSAAKGGVIAFSKALAMEVGPHNIHVNCVSPGLVPRPNEKTDDIPNTNYLQRVAKPETVANLVLFLVSEKADFIVGQNYIVDGGWSLGLKGR